MTKIILTNKYNLDTNQSYTNSNIVVFGDSGSGKSRNVVTPNLLLDNGYSKIVVDVKGALYDEYNEILKKQGYNVKKLDLLNLKESESFNFFDYINSEQDALKACEILIGSSYQKDPYWDECSKLLLLSFCLAIYEKFPEHEKNLSSVLEMISYLKRDFNDPTFKSSIDLYFEEIKKENPNSTAVKAYEKFAILNNVDRTFGCVVSTLNTKLFKFILSDVERIIENTTIKFEELIEEKSIFFIRLSDVDQSLDCLAELFIKNAFSYLFNLADNSKEHKLKRNIQFILDDASNYYIDNLPDYLATCRQRGISIMLLFQSLSQLKSKYGIYSEDIIGNCHTMLFLGSNSLETLCYMAQRINIPIEKLSKLKRQTAWVIQKGKSPIWDELCKI